MCGPEVGCENSVTVLDLQNGRRLTLEIRHGQHPLPIYETGLLLVSPRDDTYRLLTFSIGYKMANNVIFQYRRRNDNSVVGVSLDRSHGCGRQRLGLNCCCRCSEFLGIRELFLSVFGISRYSKHGNKRNDDYRFSENQNDDLLVQN